MMRSSTSTSVNANSMWGKPLQRRQARQQRDTVTPNPNPPRTSATGSRQSSSTGTPVTPPGQQPIWQRDLLHYSPPDSSRLLPSHSSPSSSPSPQATPSTEPATNGCGKFDTATKTSSSRSGNHPPQRSLQISEEMTTDAMEDQVSVLTDDQSNTWQTFPPTAQFPIVVQGRPVREQQQQHFQREISNHTFEVPWDVNLLDPSSLSIAAAMDDEGTIDNTDRYIFDQNNEEELARSSFWRGNSTFPANKRFQDGSNHDNNDNNIGEYHDNIESTRQSQQPQQQQQQHQPEDYYEEITVVTAAGSYQSVAASAGNSLRTYESRATPDLNDHDGNDDHSSTIARPTVISTTAPPPVVRPRDFLVEPDASVAPLEPAITQDDFCFESPATAAAAANSSNMDAQLARMVAEGYPSGLARAMVNLKNSEVAYQIWIVDNSGSMTTYDGTKLVSVGSALQFVKCTRWEELQDCVSVHLKLSGAIAFPMTVRLLNDPGPLVGPSVFGIGCDYTVSSATTTSDNSNFQSEMHRCLGIVNLARPYGASPLTRHIQAIYEEVRGIEPSLRSTGQKVAVVICTDGIPSDSTRSEFIDQLRRLDELPITIVIRICTDEKEVVDFYNSLDYELEISIDVIDDYHAEAEEIARHNPWLNYGRPLHRLREKGCRMKVLDLLDERPLSKQEQVDICCLIFGREKIVHGAPNPISNWPGFQKYIDELQASEELQWDPIYRKMKPWIDFRNTREKLRALKRNAKNKKTFMERILS